MEDKIVILNIGGTFNKRYNLFNGKLNVPKDNLAIEEILNSVYKSNKKPIIDGIIYKDSLDMTYKDRKKLLDRVKSIKQKKIIIIHGTDTMDKSAKFLAKKINNKQIVFVGAMKPYEIDKVESAGTLMMAIGYLNGNRKNGIFICMNGLIKSYEKIKKNYKKGVFECR